MRAILRQAALLGVSAALSWWFFLRVAPPPVTPRMLSVPPQALELTPLVRDSNPAAAPELVARAQDPPREEPERTPPATAAPEERLLLPERAPAAPATETARAEDPAPTGPPPPELGTPEGEEREESAASEEQPVAQGASAPPVEEAAGPEAPGEPLAGEEPVSVEPRANVGLELDPSPRSESAPDADHSPRPEEPLRSSLALGAPPETPAEKGQEQSTRSVQALMRDPELLAEARTEFARGHRKGFATVLLAAPEDQIEIARFFGEELVLVPRRALDPQNASPSYFRLTESSTPRVEVVEGAPSIEGYRQYRDLFDYEYGRLPAPLRELRRSVLARGEVYLFAALLSPEEWALIIARRQAALAAAGRELSEVRRFILRYLRDPGSGYDLAVDEIVFADGTRFRPADRGKGG